MALSDETLRQYYRVFADDEKQLIHIQYHVLAPDKKDNARQNGLVIEDLNALLSKNPSTRYGVIVHLPKDKPVSLDSESRKIILSTIQKHAITEIAVVADEKNHLSYITFMLSLLRLSIPIAWFLKEEEALLWHAAMRKQKKQA